MEAAKAAEFVALMPGNIGQQPDATQAYAQAYLSGIRTHVRLPRHGWPESCRGVIDPVSPLVKALYGHPDSGGCWELRCDAALKDLGFIPVPEWKSVYIHPELDLFLVVYVDDVKMAGKPENAKKGWELTQ
eukprot:14650989-Alexandrium_andersonii.AAC.1